MLNYGDRTGYYLRLWLPILLGVVLLAKHIFANKGLLNGDIFVLLYIIFVCGGTSLLHSTGIGFVFSLSLTYCAAYFITKLYSFETFAEASKQILTLISFVSIVLFVCVQFFPETRNILPIIRLERTTEQYYSLFFGNISTFTRSGLYRCSGTFWEPGIFQAYLNFGFLHELNFVREKTKKHTVRLIIYFLCIITTFSTTGYAVLALSFCYYIIDGVNKREHKWLSIIGIVFLIALMLYFLSSNELVYGLLFNKIEVASGSYTHRLSSFYGNLQTFSNHPLFGAGYVSATNEMGLLMQNVAGNSAINQTNTFTYYLSAFGLFGGSIFLLGWGKLSRKMTDSFLKTVILFLWFFLLTSSENFVPSLFFNTLLFYGLIKSDGKLVSKID